jgi:hypothetical protein
MATQPWYICAAADAPYRENTRASPPLSEPVMWAIFPMLGLQSMGHKQNTASSRRHSPLWTSAEVGFSPAFAS